MNTIREPARDIKVINDVDVVVLGGSCTGAFAAIRAARLGAKVAIVEHRALSEAQRRIPSSASGIR